METSGVSTTPETQNSNSCFSSYTSTIGTIGTRIEYDCLTGEIIQTSVGTTFMDRLREACFQRFRDHLHLPFLNIPLHLKKMVIQDMETEFGEGWSVRKVQKEMSKNCKRFQCNQSKKIKKNFILMRGKERDQWTYP